jgi:hypothetical protein
MDVAKFFLAPHERIGEAERAHTAGVFINCGTPKNKKQYPKNDIEKPTGVT